MPHPITDITFWSLPDHREVLYSFSDTTGIALEDVSLQHLDFNWDYMPLWLNDVAEVVDPGGHNVVLELPKLSSLAPKCLNRRAFIFRPTLFSTSNLHDVAFTEIAFDSVTQLARWLVSATQLRTLHFAYCGFAKNSVFATGIRGDRSFEPLGQHSIEHSG